MPSVAPGQQSVPVTGREALYSRLFSLEYMMETKLADDLAVAVYDAETDDPIPVEGELRELVDRYVEEFRAKSDGAAPVGHHPVGNYILEFTRRVSGCSQ